MAGNVISMSPEDLKATAKKIAKDSEDYKNYVNKIYAVVTDVNNVWKGEDKEQFVAKINEYKKSITDLGTVMNDYSIFLTNVANNFEKTQSEIKSLFGGRSN